MTLEDIAAVPGRRYSAFDLDGPPDAFIGGRDGILVFLDPDTYTDNGATYSAIAYRLVLDHSEVLVATRLGSGAGAVPYTGTFILGTPTPAGSSLSALSGSWHGIAIGQEEHTSGVPSSVSHASEITVESLVGIRLSTGGGSGTNVDIDFTAWQGGTRSGGYPAARFRNVRVYPPGPRTGVIESAGRTNSYRFIFTPFHLQGFDWERPTSEHIGSGGEGLFMGDNFAEVIGTAIFHIDGNRLSIVYGAKKE